MKKTKQPETLDVSLFIGALADAVGASYEKGTSLAEEIKRLPKSARAALKEGRSLSVFLDDVVILLLKASR